MTASKVIYELDKVNTHIREVTSKVIHLSSWDLGNLFSTAAIGVNDGTFLVIITP